LSERRGKYGQAVNDTWISSCCVRIHLQACEKDSKAARSGVMIKGPARIHPGGSLD